jgi:hypothetical protein
MTTLDSLAKEVNNQTLASDTNSSSFSKEWWRHFYNETNELTKAKIFKNVLSQQDIGNLMNGVYNIVKDVSDRKIPDGFRVSIDGVINNTNRDYFYNNPPSTGEDLSNWCSRVFGEKKYGVILNSCQNYDIGSKSDIYRKFKYLLEDFGIPPNGIEITLFFGNYGYTPLGFHLDPPGHKVTHLHLGPSPKQMYLIEKDTFENELGAKTGSKDFEKLIPKAIEYNFNEGDVFFMPIGMYHVGNTNELSFGLTIWHIEPSISDFQARLSIDLMKKIFSKESHTTILTRDFKAVSDTSHISNILNEVIEYDQDYENLSLRESVETLVLEHRYKLFSNAYFYGFHQNLEAPIVVPILDFNTVVQGIDPFKILYIERGEKAVLFIQGKKVIAPNHENLNEIIQKINSYLPMTLKSIFDPVLESWDSELVFYVAKEIFYRGGLEIKK